MSPHAARPVVNLTNMPVEFEQPVADGLSGKSFRRHARICLFAGAIRTRTRRHRTSLRREKPPKPYRDRSSRQPIRQRQSSPTAPATTPAPSYPRRQTRRPPRHRCPRKVSSRALTASPPRDATGSNVFTALPIQIALSETAKWRLAPRHK